MKKKFILLGLCFLLILIFTSSSYGGLGMKTTPIKEVPDQELAGKVNLSDLNYTALLIIPIGIQVPLIIPVRISFQEEYPNLKSSINRGIISKTGLLSK